MSAHQLQNALTAYDLIMSPLSRTKERKQKEGEEQERDSICRNLLLTPECLILFFHGSEEEA